ncbi:DNA repair protein (RadR) [Blumeria hordei DH14]|uniref:Postreplication repair E3 ubiquitin-protein ligase RAD18 n=1 Tax=Blumeria graminis f. sp. hordei (strain DH14) TaxID=546991 RepID=N1J857_BLUG1|nr:DNA repair protein (RadR) [Blumeria hordei DH14]
MPDNFHEADSTDWLSTKLQKLFHVDSALRCQVCKDFYSTPMITSCSHTFCSLCIRRCLSNDGRCPACRAEEQELKLRNNSAVEELVEAFKNAREEVMNFARTPKYPAESKFSPKRKSDETETEVISSTNKRTKRSRHHPEDGFVQCPICNSRMSENKMNAHLDRNCQEFPNTPSKSGTGRKELNVILQKVDENTIKRPTRLPKINFSMFKDAQLKRKLGEHGLSQGGSRQAMQKRYTEWVTLWNSNCDATKPRPTRELRGELEKWERIQEGKRVGLGPQIQTGIKIKEKGFDGVAWSSSHSSSFKELVEKARRKADRFEEGPLLSETTPTLLPVSPKKLSENSSTIDAVKDPTTL